MSGAIDAFLGQYYARHPVNATFTGVHDHDARLPDWTRDGRAADAEERSALRASLQGDASIDGELARAMLDVRDAEHESGFFIDRNPALWTGEAIFGAVSLMLRPFAPRDERLVALSARLDAVPVFLTSMRESLQRPVPRRWASRAFLECSAAQILLGADFNRWLASEPSDAVLVSRARDAADRAKAAFFECAEWLGKPGAAGPDACPAGEQLFGALLERGHLCEQTPDQLLDGAIAAIGPAQARLAMLAREAAGSWRDVEGALAADVPPPGDYLSAFRLAWDACRAVAAEHDLVTWPVWPLRYVPFPEWARESAPRLYWLFYRSPAPFDTYAVHEYLVRPDWSRSAIKLNHVVHHGALGHHVQNWHATHHARTRIGVVAAVDCASRIGMFTGGSMAEGWACYATELMDECGFLSPLERASQQHSRVRMLARAIVDISYHTGRMSGAAAVKYYMDEVGMTAGAAEAEFTKNSMFPCTAVMYWLGTQGILDLRETVKRTRRSGFDLKSFHDELLSYGSVPVPLVARLMSRVPE